jgi:hypothetical protein
MGKMELAGQSSRGPLQRWLSAYRNAARRDKYRWFSDYQSYGLEGLDRRTKEYRELYESVERGVELFLDVVSMLVAYRSLDGAATAAWSKRFLSLQRYGVEDFVGAESFVINIPGLAGHGVCLRADDVFLDVDLLDLCDHYGEVDCVQVFGRNRITKAEARELVSGIRADLERDGNRVKIDWTLEENGSLLAELKWKTRV